MIYNVYCCKDDTTGFLTPTFEPNDNYAIRSFKYACSQTSIMGFKPTDFSLFLIGTFDTDSGLIESYSTPEFICRGEKVEV